MGCLNSLKRTTFKMAGLQGSRRESHTGLLKLLEPHNLQVRIGFP